MQLRTKLIIYSTVCCALGVLLTLGAVSYRPSISPVEVAAPIKIPDITIPPFDIDKLQETVEAAIKNNEQLQQTLPLQERLRTEQIRHELQKLEQLKQEQLQIKLYKLERLKDGLFSPSVHPEVPPIAPPAESISLPKLKLEHEAVSTPPITEWLFILLFACGICALGVAWFTRHLARSLNALEVGLLNFNDNDFSVSIPANGEGQLKALAELFNDSAAKLRQERQYIYQRRLLLDKVIQSSPNVMLLFNDHQNSCMPTMRRGIFFISKARWKD